MEMRTTVRFNEAEELELKRLGQFVNEQDTSKIVKFAVATAIRHIEFVTNALVSHDWEVVFMRKRKTSEIKRKIF